MNYPELKEQITIFMHHGRYLIRFTPNTLISQIQVYKRVRKKIIPYRCVAKYIYDLTCAYSVRVISVQLTEPDVFVRIAEFVLDQYELSLLRKKTIHKLRKEHLL